MEASSEEPGRVVGFGRGGGVGQVGGWEGACDVEESKVLRKLVVFRAVGVGGGSWL